MKLPSADALRDLVGRFSSLRIGILGDFSLDGYWTVDPTAAVPSVETGKPTQPVREQRYAPGGAGNVARNLEALGVGRIHIFGVIGPDPWGDELRRQLDRPGTDLTGLIPQSGDWGTVTYLKPHIDGEEQRRVDFGDFNRLADRSAEALLARLDEALDGLDAVILNDQARSGVHTDYLRARLTRRIADRADRLFLVDSRNPESLYPGCVIKLNESEAARCLAAADPSPPAGRPATAAELAERLFTLRGRPVFITRGADGIEAHDASGPASVAGVACGGEVDPTGAGDTVVAALAAALATGADCATVAEIGNFAAAVTVRKLRQTGVATPAELLAMIARTGAS